MRVLAALAALTALAAPSPAGQLGADGWVRQDEPMPAFSLEDLEGRTLRLADLRGKVVLIDFWATWCAPCLKELPGFAEWHERLRDRDDVAVLSFNVLDETAALETYVEKHRVGFPVYRADALVEPLGIAEFPTKLIVDARGEPRIVYRRAGYAPVEVVEPKLEEVLAAAR